MVPARNCEDKTIIECVHVDKDTPVSINADAPKSAPFEETYVSAPSMSSLSELPEIIIYGDEDDDGLDIDYTEGAEDGSLDGTGLFAEDEIPLEQDDEPVYEQELEQEVG